MSAVRFDPLPDLPGHELLLLPERALLWHDRQTLLIADLHLGKTETFWSAGAPVPGGILDADLARLDRLLRRTEAKRLIVLGDLIHSGRGLSSHLVETVREWRSRWRNTEVLVVPGNHDRALAEVTDAWALTVTDATCRDGGFSFRHDPIPEPGAYTLCGHVHPLVRVSSASDSLRLPCFWMRERLGVLPAFSAFTRGITIDPAREDVIFAVADEQVIRV